MPVRFLELIAPAPFERYFEQLAPLVPEQAPPDVPAILALAARYGLEMHLDDLPRLAQQYRLTLPGLPPE
ncbi:hypothetical protein [Deinococcus aluminii]|uniref:hypothetical protein n=1 Tax=Deinococcus aluminii TaxID=1656885 RepID=UPI0031E79EB0